MNIQISTHQRPIEVDLPTVVTGFSKWLRQLPNALTLHGLAVWEIYRSHAELSDKIKRTGDQMFIRWKETVTLRILHDLTFSYSTCKSLDIFRNRWLTVPNRWFHLEPGGSDRQDRLVFAGLSPSDPRFSYFLDSQGQIGSTTDEPAAALATP
ncbi:hypothetical protein GGI05_002360 [Coemansia sp. RSA 2603]|nr:hypothetical protein GGI05_002360 [Coemansia sp. RSA 2603]